ncbi:unnamed protein product [Arabidopsis thaliana]|uniref:Uncharacterized protein n=1 Tax=Arabidopsis thaliana TaxID=3702 RepID=A0A5S9XQH7_ARATH|nr:unnamed protein product [Arabidopsis thaliana]
MEGFTNFLQVMETKVDLLARKVDLLTSKMDLCATNSDLKAMLTSMKGKNVPAKKTLAMAASDSEDSSDSSSSDDIELCFRFLIKIVIQLRPSYFIIIFAYIDLKEGANKALELNGSDMAGKELVVKTALLMRDSYVGYSCNGGIGGRFGGRFGSVGGIFGGGRCGGLGQYYAQV